MDPNLSCRMYKPRYPEDDRLVMGRVKTIVGGEAVVSLLEFNEKEAKVFNSRERDLLVGRTMAFRVSDVINKAILLSPNPLCFEDKMICEMNYLKARHVQRVLYSIADDKEMKLKDLYKLLGWPSYEELLNLHKDPAFLNSDIDSELRDFILNRIKLMVYFSWRILHPRILQFCLLVQMENNCYAIALTRQAEAYLKLKGRVPFYSYLSIQDLMNKAKAEGLLDNEEDASVRELGPVAEILESLGLVFVADCPVGGEYIRTGGPVRKIDIVRVYDVGIDVPTELAPDDIIDRLHTAPITCSVMLYPSYENSLRQDKIYGPTDAEVQTYKDKSDDLHCHTMLCTGYGVDRRGKKFLEMQDSIGNVNVVDQGYVRFAQENTVADYVYFEDFPRPAKKQKV